MFSCGIFRRGGQIPSRHRYGGPKSLPFRHIHSAIITLSAPRKGPNSIDNFDDEAMAGFAPLDLPLVSPAIMLTMFRPTYTALPLTLLRPHESCMSSIK